MSEKQTQFQAEAQKQRWLKYGLNVLISVVLVIALAVLVVWLAQSSRKRADLTASGIYSLKPQTINIIGDLKSPIKIVSLYRKVDEAGKTSDAAQTVADLLEEYRAKGRNIQVELIDPVREKDKVEDLYSDLVRRYGSEMKNYQAFVDDLLGRQLPELKKAFDAEADAVAPLATMKLGADDDAQTATTITSWFQQFPDDLDTWRKSVERLTKEKHPEYKAIVDLVRDQMGNVSRNADQIAKVCSPLSMSAGIPDPVRKYFAAAGPRIADIKKKAEDILAAAGKLGQLKVDDVKNALKVEDPVLVMGEKDYRVISAAQMWPVDDQSIRGYAVDGKIKPRFAGEQQLTTAILTLAADKKPKVVFFRPMGAPLASPGYPPFVPGGPLSRVADRLRDCNFEVLEKDLSGQYAAQAQMRGMPAEPEPSDEQLKDAVWIILNIPTGRQQPTAPPAQMGPKLAEHLKAGGSAMVLSEPGADDLSAALSDWGVSLKTDTMVVHDRIPNSGTRVGDMVEEAQRIQSIFLTRDYGNHPLAVPLKSLDAIFLSIVPVQTTSKPGFRAWPLLPVPQAVKIWGTRQIEAVNEGKDVTFDAKTDLAPPLFGGAAVEKEGAGRLVVLGALQFIGNELVRYPDQELLKERIRVARFPGNAELFVNSVFWLARADTLIAISPTAMEVSRIKDMPQGMQNFWRYGFLMGIMPAAVLVAGLLMYLRRRD